MRLFRLPRRTLLVQAPGRLRALVRRSEVGLVLLAAAVGGLGGAVVAGMGGLTQWAREALYRLPSGAHLSAAQDVSPLLLLSGPAVGGVLLGLLILAARRWQPGGRRPAVDPIEANALHGGRMSLGASVNVAVQNVVSNGSGASVGLEAGYTQLASGLASRLGAAFELRRSDLRTLVGCGSAAAIAAAFGSPLTGAFYAFEMVIGTYTIAALAPVVAAALCGSLIARAFSPHSALLDVGGSGLGAAVPVPLTGLDTIACLVLGLVCAGLGIGLMRGVTLVERLFDASRLPPPLRPALGGLCVGALAVAVSPQVLSGGHGALHLHLAQEVPTLGAGALLLLLAAKAAASAVSIGAGFRGGLFFASLFLGALTGRIFASLGAETWPGFADLGLTPLAYAVVGMSALSAAIVGCPLTMTFLTLELTGSFPLAGLVLAAVIAASLTVRKAFGYSFATWRFHLRGESIRSAHDVGWIRSLTVGRLMRRDVRPVAIDTSLPAFLRAHPLGSASRVVLVDEAGRYAGLVLVPEAHALAAEAEEGTVPTLAHAARYADAFLLPGMNAKEAEAAFDRAESEALAVVDDRASRRVLGLLTESHTLRRYSQELDRQRRAMAGEGG